MFESWMLRLEVIIDFSSVLIDIEQQREAIILPLWSWSLQRVVESFRGARYDSINLAPNY